MAKLIMLKGISGSGKSTYAKDLTVKNNNTYRVNRDELRLMMYDGKWNNDKEKAVIAAQKSIVMALLTADKTVIVDDTNLLKHHENMWKQIAESVHSSFFGKEDAVPAMKTRFEIKEIKPDLKECIARDKTRVGKQYITEAVIQRQAIKSGMYNVSTEDNSVVFCDIDGTIADGAHREGVLKDKTNKNRWQQYFARCGGDLPIKPVIEMLRAYQAEGKTIILVSGRAADMTLDDTLNWLKLYDVPYDRLLMRLGGDGRVDTEVKKDILREFLIHHPKECIHTVIDDRPSVVNMWKSEGLPVIQVYKGEVITDATTTHRTGCKNTGLPIDGRCDSCGALQDF